MRNLLVLMIILFCILSLASCPGDLLNANGRWNPLDPNYDAEGDPDRETPGPDCTIRLISPATGYYTGKLTTMSVPFSWSVSDDTDIVSYHVRIGNAEDLASATVKEIFSSTATSVTVDISLATHGSYNGYWQVGAMNAGGNITWSEARRIRVGITVNDYNGDGYTDILAGAPFYSTNIGRVWLYKGEGGSAPTVVCNWVGMGSYVWLGQSLNFIGDYNGDGKADFAVGDPQTGQVRVHVSNQSGFPETGDWQIVSSGIGSALAGGDFNNDGYDDMAVGAANTGTNPPGKIYLFLGNESGVNDESLISESGDVEWGYLGNSLVMADVNNDGYDDIIAGAYGGNETTPLGKLYIYYGGSTPDLTVDLKIESPAQNYLGFEVAAGDINGDGYADIVAGVPGDDTNNDESGAVYVYAGGESISSTPAKILMDEFTGWANLKAGYSVDCGDINGDGLADILVGSPGYGGSYYWGALWIYPGVSGSSINVSDYDLIYNSPTTEYPYAGQCVSVVGDVDNDGVNDIAYALPGADESSNDNRGRIGIIFGDTLSLTTPYDVYFNGSSDTEQLGGIQRGGSDFTNFYYGRTIGRM